MLQLVEVSLLSVARYLKVKAKRSAGEIAALSAL